MSDAPNRNPVSALHALPAPPARRRFALPSVLMGIAMLAFGGLAVLPAGAPPEDVLIAQAAAAGPTTPAVEPLVRPQAVQPRAAAKKPAPAVTKPAPVVKNKPAPAPRPAVKRATRSKRVEVITGAGYACPVAGRHSFTNDYGDPRSGGRRHAGNDVLAAYGTPLVAVTSGIVKTAYSSAGGISLYLRGDDGAEYYYAHNSRNVASSGERVSKGEVVAHVGTSGNARGGPAHVHFERHPGGRQVNPFPFLVAACR